MIKKLFIIQIVLIGASFLVYTKQFNLNPNFMDVVNTEWGSPCVIDMDPGIEGCQ